VESHRSTCEKRPIVCDFAGCGYEVSRFSFFWSVQIHSRISGHTGALGRPFSRQLKCFVSGPRCCFNRQPSCFGRQAPRGTRNLGGQDSHGPEQDCYFADPSRQLEGTRHAARLLGPHDYHRHHGDSHAHRQIEHGHFSLQTV
jgi:hypothetical protein